ncbi:hypothetical protein BYT27DRAFT_7236215 [Phlegmacium glaucopus]|nr:hypothetical protein BYT27DRAFT_7236215 [Phlegmacium glaucopus]
MNELLNTHGSALCAHHDTMLGSHAVVNPTEACDEHQLIWKKHSEKHSQQHLSGDHCEAGPENPQRPHYFSPAQYYCVETMCAPCGVVIAWTKFDKSESPTNVLNFLGSVHPTQDSQPQYVCIDKACMLLWTANSNGSWDSWQQSTWSIVDSYHYTNHQASDILCQKWCNPTPTDGSIILKCMAPGNFNWFLHSLLFLHTQYVVKKENMDRSQNDDEASSGGISSDNGSDSEIDN